MRNPIPSLYRSLRIHGLWHTLWRMGARLSYLVEYRILKRPLAKRRIHGSPMYLDLRNKGISEPLYLEGTREEVDVEVVKREVRPGMTILEVGANIGYYLLLEAKLMEGKGAIYAFEPDPRNVALLSKNIELNGLTDMVRLFPHAVSDTDGTATFYLARHSNLSSMQARTEGDTGVEVKTVRVDDFPGLPETVDFIRMDIESFEIEALAGMRELLSRSNARILLELHKPVYTPDRHFLKTAEDLFSLGYHVRYLISSGQHRPPEITALGYEPTFIAYDMARSHGLYENVSDEDFLTLMRHPKKLVRSVMFARSV